MQANDRIDAMTTFIAIVESGSISAAARRMGIAKSAVSRRLVGLESHLGTQLLRRTTRRQSLTDGGQFYFEQCQRILADIADVESRLSLHHHNLEGQLKIAVPAVFGLHHLATAIDDFRSLHPALLLNIDFNDRRLDLVHEGFDLAIRIGRLEDSSLKARFLFDARMVMCASPSYLRENGIPATPEALVDHRLIHHGHLPNRQWRYLDPQGKEQLLSVEPNFISNHGDFNCDAAIRDRGIILMPLFICHAALREGKLQPILREYNWNPVSAYALYPPTRHLSVRARALIDFLVERFRPPLPWEPGLEEILSKNT